MEEGVDTTPVAEDWPLPDMSSVLQPGGNCANVGGGVNDDNDDDNEQ